jgi:glycosyltransferase involved in cell wall biosynthesis
LSPSPPPDVKQRPTLSVVIPVFNERQTLAEILDRVAAVEGIDKEIILVDDFSTDGTRELLRDELAGRVATVVYHERNQGKGAAIRTGIGHATGRFLVIQDADLEYDPNDYHLLLRPLLEDRADVVYGSRFLPGSERRVTPFWHYMVNRMLTLLSNMLSNLSLTDMETCYKTFRTEIAQGIEIEENRFGLEPEVTAKIAKINGLRIFEVPISYDARGYREGKKIGWRDGLRALWCILKYNLFRRR